MATYLRTTTILALAILALWTPTLAQPPMTLSVTNHDRNQIHISCVHNGGQAELRYVMPGQADQVIPIPPVGSGGVCRGLFQNACESVLYSEERGDARLAGQQGISVLADAAGFQRKYVGQSAWELLQAECPRGDYD